MSITFRLKRYLTFGVMALFGLLTFLLFDRSTASSADSIKSAIYVNAASKAESADGSKEKPFTTIGAAISTASDYSHIYVESGTYIEELVIDKKISLHCIGTDKPRITALPGTYSIIYFESSESSIDNCYFAADFDDEEFGLPVGIMVRAEGPGEITIRNCIFEETQVGIEVQGSVFVKVEDNVFRFNRTGLSSLPGNSNVIAEANVFENNDTGIFSVDSNITVLENEIVKNQRGIQLASRTIRNQPFRSIVSGNTIKNNSLVGLWIDHWIDTLEGTTTEITGNTFSTQSGDDIGIESRANITSSSNLWLTKKLKNIYSKTALSLK